MRSVLSEVAVNGVVSGRCRVGRAGALAALVLTTLVLAACGQDGDGKAGESAKSGPPPAIPVTVAQAVEKTINDWDEFVGRVEAVERVELRPRVSGYLQGVSYRQGADVGQGQVMFEIDAEPFQVEVKRAEAELARVRARLDLARAERLRSEKLVESGAVSRQEVEQSQSVEKDSEAALRSLEASLATARLNLGYTRVLAPISGRSGRAEVTAGNFVTAGQTVLTTIVKLHPIYVTFEVDEQAYLKFAGMARSGEMAGYRKARNPVFVGLANEDGYPAKGAVEFVDNRVNPQTGTVYARALLDNRDGRFAPGLFARVKLVSSGTYSATLIDERAIGTDQNKRFVLAVGPDGQTQYREVKLGPVVDGLRVVREGLKPGETIIVDGLQRVRPGMTVQPTMVAMNPKDRAGAAARPGAPPGNAPAKGEGKAATDGEAKSAPAGKP